MKRGQMDLSFGMIFSIILIIIFIGFAFFAISKFLDIQKTSQIAMFIDELQTDVDKMWQGSQGSQEKTYSIPKKIEFVCFIDFELSANNKKDIYNELGQIYSGQQNMFFYPIGSGEGLDSKEIKHLNLEKITRSENPFCIENENGKVKMVINKGFGDALVNIER